MSRHTGKKGNTYPGWVKFNPREMKNFYLPDTDFIAVRVNYKSEDKYRSTLSKVYEEMFYQPQFARDSGERSEDMRSAKSREKDDSPNPLKVQEKQEYLKYKSYTDKYYDELEKLGKL